MTDIDTWLQNLQLQQYTELFTQNDIDFEVLELLTENDMSELGISLGHRKKILKALTSSQRHAPAKEAEVLIQRVASAVDHSAEAERRFMSLMFCDLADSTRIAAALDMEDMHVLNRAYQSECTRIIESYGGYVARYMGDGILAYFGYPTAKEDDAERAINAGLEIGSTIGGMNQRFTLPGDLSLFVRVGISSGSVVVEAIGSGGARENAVVGEAPNLAARLQGLAAANSVMIGPDTQNLIEHAFELKDCGKKPVKGYSEEMQTWQVVGSRSFDDRLSFKSGRYLTSLIGRDEEYELLRSRWERSVSGAGQVVLLSGEAGIGKTRLVDALLEGITESQQKARLFCAPHNAQNPLHPFVNRLLREAGVESGDSISERRQKMSRQLQSAYKFDDKLIDGFLSLAFLDSDGEASEKVSDPRHMMQLLHQKIVESIVELSHSRPMILVVEDAHWIDASSQKVLDMLAERIHTQRVMLLISFRKEKSIVYASPNVTSLSLSSLTNEDGQKLIRELAVNANLSEEVVNQISRKAAGVPLFLEEVAKSATNNRIGIGQADEFHQNAIPDTLQATLLSVLDRLGEARQLAQLGAVVGNTFGRDILAHISNQPNQHIDVGLNELVSNQVTVRASEGENYLFRFRHALLRDAAYESLLKTNRTRIHAMIAKYLGNSQNRAERSSQSLIAYHYEMAAMTDQAFASWVKAGESALSAGATTESAELLEKAFRLLPKVSEASLNPEDLYLFHMCRGKAFNASKGAISNEAHESFASAVSIAEEANNIEQQVDALDYLFGITFNAGFIRDSIIFAKQMLEIGKVNENVIATVSGHQGLGMAHCTLGEFNQAREHLEAALAFEDQDTRGINCFPSMTLDYISFVEYFTGNNEDAIRHCDQAIASARNESDYATAVSLSNSCFTQMMLGNHQLVIDYSREALQLAKVRGQLMVVKRASLFHNLSTAWIEQSIEHLAKVVEATNQLFNSGEVIDLTYLIGMTAELQIQLKLFDDAANSLERALTLSRDYQENFYRAELFRLKAELILQSSEEPGNTEKPRYGSRDDANLLLDQAFEIANSQQANGWINRLEITKQSHLY